MPRPKNVVSTKIALYSDDLRSVLVMYYPGRNIRGLPGGHVEPKENPDEAVRRELFEELTLTAGEMKRADFFLRHGTHGAIILAYTAIVPRDITIVPTDPKFEYAEWKTKAEIEQSTLSATEYTRFVLENWPKTKA